VTVSLPQKCSHAPNRIWVDIDDIAHPGNHAHFVIELSHDDLSAPRNLPWREHLKHSLVPLLYASLELRVQVAHHVLRLAILADESGARVLGEDPIRNAFMGGFCHDVGPRADDDIQAHAGS